MCLRVTVFVAEYAELREMGVRDLEALDFCVGYNAVDGNVGGVLVLVENHGVTMGESTSLDILTAYSDVEALVDQTGESQSFSGSPVNALALDHRLVSVIEDLLDLWVEVPVFG